jgi:hypothetical protein
MADGKPALHRKSATRSKRQDCPTEREFGIVFPGLPEQRDGSKVHLPKGSSTPRPRFMLSKDPARPFVDGGPIMGVKDPF